jgi:hypothetical protein
MYVVVEPWTGHELDRLITALLNGTGTVHRLIEATARPADADGVEFIGTIAERLRGILAPVAEHYGDEELAAVTGLLAHITLLVAGELGLEGYFRPE